MQSNLHDGIRAFRRFLDEHHYESRHITQHLGSCWPPQPGEAQSALEKTSEISIPNILIRLFLLGQSIDAQTIAEFVPDEVMKFCLTARLLQLNDDRIQACVVIVPVEELLFVSDAFRVLASDEAADFVLPASTHAAEFLRYSTMREPLSSALDLGCGCGIHALFAAAHCERVVATDINPAAIRYTRFNAILNDVSNVECLEGSLFEPVEKQTFDLIISNPPFVVSPSASFTYRDSDMELDDFCQELVRHAPMYLREGGHLQMLCEWVDTDDSTWTETITNAVRGCDAWILHSQPVSPEDYVKTRHEDVSGEAVDAGSSQEWRDYLQQRAVRAIHPCMLVLRKRTANNWLHVQNMTADVSGPVGHSIRHAIDAVDFLECCDDASLLDAVFGHAPDLNAEAVEADEEFHLSLNNGLPVKMTVDASVAAFMQCFDGQCSVAECTATIVQMAQMADADAQEMTKELLSIVRLLVSRGFLIAVDAK